MSSYISNDELLDRIQKLEKEIEKLKERNNAETKEIIINTAREEVKYQSSIIKNEVRDELRKDLATKEDIMLAEERLEKKIALLEKKVDMSNQKMDYWTKILIILIIISPFIPEALKSIGLILR
jgi:FtsZ-binding cell division protein ZapB